MQLEETTFPSTVSVKSNIPKILIVAPFIVALSIFCILSFTRSLALVQVYVELIELILGFIIFSVAFNSYYYNNKKILLIVGIAYLFRSILSLFEFSSHFALLNFFNYPMVVNSQFELLARTVECSGFIYVFLLEIKILSSKFKVLSVFILLFIISILGSGLIMAGYFPVNLNEQGMITTFGIILEIVIGLIYLTFAWLIFKNNAKLSITLKAIFIGFIIKWAIQFISVIGTVMQNTNHDIQMTLRLVFIFLVYEVVLTKAFRYPLSVYFSELRFSYVKLVNKTKRLKTANEQLSKEIEEKMKIEKNLKESNELHQYLLEMLPDGVCIINKDLQIKYANAAASQICGIERKIDMSQNTQRLCDNLLDEEQKEYLKGSISRLSEGLCQCVSSEYSILLQGDTQKIVEFTSRIIIYKGEEAIITVIRDMAERKKVEELEKNIEANRKKLKEAIDSNMIKTEYFANLSHELRTPLNIILGSIQLFELYIKSDNLVKIKNSVKHITTMRQNCKRLLRLVNNIIDSTKIDSGFFELHMQKCDVVELTNNIVSSISEFCDYKKLILDFETNISEKVIELDPDKIERVLLNLLSNAIKFTPPGGVISVKVFGGDNFLTILISDTGEGIPPEKQELIFERFKQAGINNHNENQGSGIGLSLCKSFVEMHNGRIFVSSRPGCGSEFALQLPSLLKENGYEMEKGFESHSIQLDRLSIEFAEIYKDDEN